MFKPTARQRGFTLLEVLLALALAVVLLSLLSFTINVYMKASDAGRGEVERAQLARVLLRRMADDLRSTLWRNEGEAATTEEEGEDGSATASGEGTGTGSGAGTGATSGAGTGESSATGTGTGSGESSSSSSTSVADATALPPVMGLYGNQYEIQVDVSRLPRIEQYASAIVNAADIVSDVKTVAYYCQSNSTGATTTTTGLTRREFDRAVTNYASANGDISAWEQEMAPLAAEVAAVEFQYYDGKEWLKEWDSEAKQALPMMVEIAIALNESATSDSSQQTIYRLLVFIPQSQAPQTSGASALETMVSTSISSASGSGSDGASGDGATGAPRGGGSSGRGGGAGPGGAPGGDGGEGAPDGGGDRGGQDGDEDDAGGGP